MKISIVTISYNQAQYLEQAILSVIKQDYPDKEYIVVDAGSTDGSREIIEKYRDRIDKIIFEPDEGPADGLNKGFACASGEIFGFLNADDALLPGALKKVAKEFKKCPIVDVICGHIYLINKDSEIIKSERSTHFTPRRYLYGAVQVTQQGTFFRKRIYEKTAGFNVNNRTSWDGELFLDIALAGGCFRVIDEFIGLFRIHSSSITGSRRLKDQHIMDHRRNFRRVLGREWKFTDRTLSIGFRLLKWACNPKVFIESVRFNLLRIGVRPKPCHSDLIDQ